MKTLIKKDFKMVGTLTNMSFIILLLLLVVFFRLIDDVFFRFIYYIGLVLMMIGMAYSRIWAHDFYYKGDILLNSLPIDRKTIVASRYATVMLYILLFSLLTILLLYIFPSNANLPATNISEIINLTSIIISLLALYLPLYYLNGHKDKRTSDIGLFSFMALILIIRNTISNENLIYRTISNLDLSQFSFILLAISLILYLGSLYISVKIYNNREF